MYDHLHTCEPNKYINCLHAVTVRKSSKALIQEVIAYVEVQPSFDIAYKKSTILNGCHSSLPKYISNLLFYNKLLSSQTWFATT